MSDAHDLRDRSWRLSREIEFAVPDCSGPYALLDFPNHGNPGDAAIWVGERRVVEDLFGARPAYSGGVGCFSADNLARRVGDGVIFLHGGGNFGDLWERHQLFREHVIRSRPENPIVMLAQTIHFESTTALDRARSVIDGHGSVTLLLRDDESAEIARREFSCPVQLCPDGAFGIGSLDRSRPASVDVLFLLRCDKEKKADVSVTGMSDSSFVTDWVQSRGTLWEWMDQSVRRRRSFGRIADRLLHGISGRLGDSAGRSRLQRAVDTLSLGRVVITDRLHGHIISTLLGIPNIVLDNSYGKNRRYYETWSRADPMSAFSDDPSEALEKARKLAKLAETDLPPDPGRGSVR